MQRIVAVLAVSVLVQTSAAQADAVSDFYQGKTIRVIVAGGAGASLGLYSRVFSEAMGKYIPGNPTLVPDFRGGAGGTIAPAFMANAAPHDGTHIGLILPPTVYAPLLSPQKYDASSEARNRLARATSSGSPIRASGWPTKSLLISSRGAPSTPAMGESMPPGKIPLTRIPRWPSSIANVLVSPRKAHLLAT